MRFKQVGHGQREDLPAARVGVFAEPYLHYNFSHGMRRWLEKHMRYAQDEAALLIEARKGKFASEEIGTAAANRRRLKRLAVGLPLFLRPVARFVYVYLWRQGFRDGHAGLVYALMLSVYEGMTAVFVYEKLIGANQELTS
jgi:hypothetical protein